MSIKHNSTRWAAAGGLAFCLLIGQALLTDVVRAEAPTGLAARPEADFPSQVLRYAKAEAAGPVAELKKRIEQGEAHLKFHPDFGYLPGVLEELKIPQSSQLLVFSKTSCQRDRISPRTPRALYFNDRVYVAWIPGSPLLEISCVDPKLGAVFYTLDQKESPRPRLVRHDQCLECHTSQQTLGVPGYVVRSYGTDGNGTVDITDGCSMVDHRTPLGERWGGWYVGGNTTPPDRGNPLGRATQPAPEALALETSQSGRVADLSKYPRSTSDMVALLILAHQAQMQNLITRLQSDSAAHSGAPGDAAPDKALSEALLKYLLFVDEAVWSSPIQSTPEFAAWFEGQGPRDKQGRSLRQLDLRTRLFKFPCSYMIYSAAFDALPRSVKLHLYHRLWRILNGEDPDSSFASIPTETRRSILEILVETKADIPIDWKL